MMVLTVAVLVVALSGVALATSEPLSRFVGTAGDDSLRGTAKGGFQAAFGPSGGQARS